MNFKIRLLCGLIASLCPFLTQADKFQPHEVVAVYIYQISNFVFWNEEPSKTHIYFCVQDDDKVKQTLAKVIEGKTIRDLTLAVVNSSNQPCDIIYYGKPLTSERVRSVGGYAVTISSQSHFLRDGGIIALQEKRGQDKTADLFAEFGQ
ncbi:hypothetical protein AUQ44_20900 [Vibrio cidicii]|uniref:YfiR family protein n=1 Tax=Vibrio cidicii TaxID=1763883 RepID=A0A151JF24_9VIBR|nr:hypothetical protein AUQ44_20900 [Vibrio cidicii]